MPPCPLPGDNPAAVKVVCTILAGPNGSGKSSIFEGLNSPGRFINADIEARRLNPTNPEAASFAAGKVVLRELAIAIQARESFVYETTLSSHQSVELIRRALDAGYRVELVFVALHDADLNVSRVATRVVEGGHDIPEPVIRRRYETSMARLGTAIRLVHSTMIHDNSAVSGPGLLLHIADDTIEVNNLDEAKALHVRIAAIVGEALDISPEAVFCAARPAVP